MTTENHLNQAISSLDEIEASGKRITKVHLAAIQKARRILEVVVIEIEDK